MNTRANANPENVGAHAKVNECEMPMPNQIQKFLMARYFCERNATQHHWHSVCPLDTKQNELHYFVVVQLSHKQ